MLRAFLWMLACIIADAVGGKLMGKPDGSATYFLFRGATLLTGAGCVGCALWFVVASLAWAWSHM